MVVFLGIACSGSRTNLLIRASKARNRERAITADYRLGSDVHILTLVECWPPPSTSRSGRTRSGGLGRGRSLSVFATSGDLRFRGPPVTGLYWTRCRSIRLHIVRV